MQYFQVFCPKMADDNIVTVSQINIINISGNKIDKKNRHLNFISFSGRPSLLSDKKVSLVRTEISKNIN